MIAPRTVGPALRRRITPRQSPSLLFAALAAVAACGPTMLPVGEGAPPTDAGDGGAPEASGPDASHADGRLPDARVTEGGVDSGRDSGDDVRAAGSPDAAADASGPVPFFAACARDAGWSWCNPQPSGASLAAVWGSGPEDVWAVGTGGLAEHWTGSSWSIVPTGTTLELVSVGGTGPRDAWAVGSTADGNGTEAAMSVILHWQGSTWTVSETVPSSELWSVWASTTEDAWVVGASDPGNALILHWNGQQWSPVAVPEPTPSVLYGVSGSDATHVWAVGNGHVLPDGSTTGMDGSFLPEILGWNGSTWTVAYDNSGMADANGLPLAVWASGPTDVWTATNGSPLHFDGTTWQVVGPPPPGTVGPTSFGGSGPSDVWGTLGSSMASWTGSSWTAAPATVGGIASPGRQTLAMSSVWSSSASSAWAVGEGGALARWDGSSWQTLSPMPEVLATWVDTADDAWAVGAGGAAVHWSAGAWSQTDTRTTQPIIAVWGASSTEVYSIASDSTMRLWDGETWRAFAGPPAAPLIAITGNAEQVWVSTGPNDVIVGSMGDGGGSGPSNSGQLASWNGTAWSLTRVPFGDAETSSWVEALWSAPASASASSDVWGVGYANQANALASTTAFVVRWDGQSWSLSDTPLESGPTLATEYSSIWGSSSADVWVAGSAAGLETAALIHWNGVAWEDVTSELPAAPTGLGAIWGSGADDVWMWAFLAGTLQESLLHWNGSAWSVRFTLPDVWSYGNALGGSGPSDLWAFGSGGMILHHT